MNRDMANAREEFESHKTIYDSVILTFRGTDGSLYGASEEGWTVYNCSVPFRYGGTKYIFGRVERHNEWARSHVRLFRESALDVFDQVPESMIYQLEDPYIQFIRSELVMGGTRVTLDAGKLSSYDASFYRGRQIENLTYYTQGPQEMKDIRLVPMPDGIGVFSRPNGKIGFTIIDSLKELTAQVIRSAPLIEVIDENGWAGCNQCYYLSSGKIGVASHQAYRKKLPDGGEVSAYMNTCFVFDPITRKILDWKILGTRNCYPDFPLKKKNENGESLADVAFTSGLTIRKDGKVDLYSGLSDAAEGRITIDYPFEGYGSIILGDTLRGE